MRLNQFDYFRAIAILIIAAGHNTYEVFVIDTFAEKVLVNLVEGGTALFVFISGFFFHYIYYQTFDFKRFMLKKIQNVLVPYITLTTIVMLFYLLTYEHQNDWIANAIAHTSNGYEIAKLYVKILLSGAISAPYWYIPFIMTIFLISPLFIWYIKLPTWLRWCIVSVMLLISTIIFRPKTHFISWHPVLYFTPIYLLGINISINRTQFVHFIHGKAWIFGLAALFLAMIQAYFYNVVGNFEKDEIFDFQGFDIIIIQEVFLCFFFLSVLQRFENRNFLILKHLASASFAIYFLHEFVKLALMKLNILLPLQFLPQIIIWLILISAVVFLSFLLALLIKRVLKLRSKFLIGW